MVAEILCCAGVSVATGKLTRSPRDLQVLRSPPDTVSVAIRKPAFKALPAFYCLPASTVQNGTAAAARMDSTMLSSAPHYEPPKSCSLAKVVVIDNYDSFTYNLCQYLGDLGCNYEVFRNDEITIDELKARKPRGILISPGPGKIVRSPNGVVHGKTSPVFYDEKGEDGLLAGLPNPFTACRYHSLVIDKESFPSEELEITAWTADGLIMGIRHRKYRHVQGVQFHPESIITQDGKRIVANFLKILDAKDLAKETI